MSTLRQRLLHALKPKHSGVKLSPAGRRYDWRKDLPDRLDKPFHSASLMDKTLPAKVDLRDQCPAVYNQGSIGSCTGNSWAFMNDFIQLQELYGNGDTVREYDPNAFINSSRLQIYWNERQMMGTPMEDSGAYLRLGAQALAQFGTCPETLHPYTPNNVFREPGVDARAEALKHKATVYTRLNSLRDMRACLADGFPFVFGFTVYESFDSGTVGVTGIMQMPGEHDRNIGGHAVACCGYDDEHQVFIIRNSWGADWGHAGYFYMPYAYMSDENLASDFWTLRK